MKALVLLALAALAALPLSAHDAWHEPRRAVVEVSHCAPHPRWDSDYRHDRWEHRGWYRRPDWDDRDGRVFLRPLPRPLGQPFVGQVEFRFR
jgi:hypothetical protein